MTKPNLTPAYDRGIEPATPEIYTALHEAAWSSEDARLEGLSKLSDAVANTNGIVDPFSFRKQMAHELLHILIPAAMRAAASVCNSKQHKGVLIEAADSCSLGTSDEPLAIRSASIEAYGAAQAGHQNKALWKAANHAGKAAYAAYALAHPSAIKEVAEAIGAANQSADVALSKFADSLVHVLTELGAPGPGAPLKAAA